MELPKTTFDDRPGTRMRIVLPVEVLPRRWTWSAFAWVVKLTYVFAAGAFCAAVASFAPSEGPAIGPFVPPGTTLFAHVPSGAALHQALLNTASLGELLDDLDTAEVVDSKSLLLDKTADNPPRTVRETLDADFAMLDAQPWFINWLVALKAASSTSRLAAFYPFLGDECAVALVPLTNAAKRGSPKYGTLIFTRVHGSSGHLARMGLTFFHGNKNVEVFDLGGGLIAIGLQGARPALEKHAPPMVVSAASEKGAAAPLLQVSFSPAAAVPLRKNDEPIDLTNEIMARLFEDNVPESVLQAIQSPPPVTEMLNCKAPPVLARIGFFAAPEGRIVARGRIDGEVPPLPVPVGNGNGAAKTVERKFGEFSAPDVMGEIVLPVDMRPAFLRYVGDAMRINPGVAGLTRRQRMWIMRLGVLARDRVDLERDFWPAVGHVAALQIHEDKNLENGSEQGVVKAWLPYNAAHPETLAAAASLARARWDYLFESDEKATVKPPYVVHYDRERADHFVLATGKNIAPAWSIGADGLRIISDAGAGVFAQGGPKNSDFPPAPAALDGYRVRLDGPRLANTIKAFVTYYYDEAADDLGPQQFIVQHKDYERQIRLAHKWGSLLGKFELEVMPDAGGAEINLVWQPASMSAGVHNKITETKKDDDDAPPPPPPPIK